MSTLLYEFQQDLKKIYTLLQTVRLSEVVGAILFTALMLFIIILLSIVVY